MKDYYKDIHGEFGKTIAKSLKDPEPFGSVHTICSDLEKWLEILEPRPEVSIIPHISEQLKVSVYLNGIGCYRASFGALRLSLELAFGLAHFSTNRLELAEWQKGEIDLVWAKLIDEDSGVLSHRYCRAFFPELESFAREHRALAIKLYRELSEHVHGNMHTLNFGKASPKFNAELRDLFVDSVRIFSGLIMFVFCLRFANEIPSLELSELEETLMGHLGHVQPVRDKLAMA